MSGFSAEWLTLREPADVAARSLSVTAFVAGTLGTTSAPTVVDLGTGTGSNVRYLAPRLPQSRWRLVDNDDALLTVATRVLPYDVEPRLTDLLALEASDLSGAALVTASALLDLVSESWLARLVRMTRTVGASALWVLNYDGRITCSPQDPDDETVRTLVNRHQQTDKGLGPALGPRAGECAERLLREAGYDVCREASDWHVGADQSELQRQLIDGWASAASELDGAHAEQIEAWRVRRQAHVTAGISRLIVGHDDVGAVLRT